MLQPRFGFFPGPIPPLQLQQHGVETLRQRCHFGNPAHRNLTVERSLLSQTLHLGRQIGDSMRGVRCLAQRLLLQPDSPQQYEQPGKQAHDRERKLEKLERERVDTMREIVGPVMGFEEVDRSGDIVIEARNLAKAYDQVLFHDLNVAVLRGQCVGVMGPNGSGKTTLIKTLIGQERADRGEVKLGHRVQVGYHDQNLQSLSPSTTVVRAVWPEDDPEWVEGDVRNLLARFGLTGELVFQTVGQLSGGEKAKAALARLCATAANLLVMDEPTNHLDIWSCEALERSIREFEGTVLVVSHDRYFLNKVVTKVFELQSTGLLVSATA